jgi:hypothetical protein
MTTHPTALVVPLDATTLATYRQSARLLGLPPWQVPDSLSSTRALI